MVMDSHRDAAFFWQAEVYGCLVRMRVLILVWKMKTHIEIPDLSRCACYNSFRDSEFLKLVMLKLEMQISRAEARERWLVWFDSLSFQEKALVEVELSKRADAIAKQFGKPRRYVPPLQIPVTE